MAPGFLHGSGQAGTVATDTKQCLLDFLPGGLTLCRAFESGTPPPEVHPGPKQRDVFFILLRGVDQAVVSPAAISITAMAAGRSRSNCSGLDEAD